MRNDPIVATREEFVIMLWAKYEELFSGSRHCISKEDFVEVVSLVERWQLPAGTGEPSVEDFDEVK